MYEYKRREKNHTNKTKRFSWRIYKRTKAQTKVRDNVLATLEEGKGSN